MKQSELRSFLNQKADEFEHPDFISSDPIQVPHMFSDPQDIEIAGILTATISWGQRVTIIKNAMKMMDLMDRSPHAFVCEQRPRTSI